MDQYLSRGLLETLAQCCRQGIRADAVAPNRNRANGGSDILQLVAALVPRPPCLT